MLGDGYYGDNERVFHDGYHGYIYIYILCLGCGYYGCIIGSSVGVKDSER